MRSEETLATIEVVAEPITDVEQSAPTAFATVIDPAEHREPVETLSEALAETVGVQVRRFGGLGAFSTLSIRGSSSNQIRIHLDGIPLSRARNETVNLADLPFDSLERIEVFRGTTPARFGVGAIGGVVNLVTREPSAEPATELALSYGSFDTRKLVASHSRRLGELDLLGFATYLGSEGDFSFLDDNGTEQNRADDFETTRRNNAFDSVEALLKAGYSIAPDLRLDFTSETFFKDQGVPGPGNRNRLGRTASLSELRTLHYLRGTASGLLSGTAELSTTIFGIFQRQEFSDPRDEVGGGRQDRRDDTVSFGTTLIASWVPVNGHSFEWLVEGSYELVNPEIRIPPTERSPDQSRLQVAVAGQDQVSFFDGRLLLVPTLRFQHLRDRFSSSLDAFLRPSGPQQTTERDLWSPSLGLAGSLTPWLTLKGNIGRFARAPNLSELFGTTGNVAGSIDLVTEKGLNRDLGFMLSLQPWGWMDRLQLEYAYFNNDFEDLIVLVNFAQGRFKPVNIGAARVRGHELSLATRWIDHLSFDLNYTHQDSENRGNEASSRGRQLPLQPADELYLRISGFHRAGKIYYELSHVGGNFLDRANFDAVPSREIHTLGLTVTPFDWMAITFEARNLTDNQIRDVGKFPLPGRSFFGTVRVNL